MDARRHLLFHGALQLALCFVLALLVIDVGNRTSWRADLTRDGRYSLSDAGRHAAEALERPLVARVFFTSDLAAPFHDHRRALLDLLTELQAHADVPIRIEVVDPGLDPEQVARAAEAGVQPIPYAYRSRDRSEARAVYLGVALEYGERSVALSSLPSLPRMEYELVGAIRSLTVDLEERPTVGWWLGHGEPDPTSAPADSPLGVLVRDLASRANFRVLALGDAAIPEEINVLIVAAPQYPVPTSELWWLDGFLMRGGSVLVFASSQRPDFARNATVEVDHDLYAWLGHHGVTLRRDLLLDRDTNEVLSVPLPSAGSRRTVRVHHPLAVVTADLDRAVPAVRALSRVVVPFASGLTVADPLPEGVAVEVWAKSDATSSAVKGLNTLDPNALSAKLSSEVPGPHPVIVALTGRFSGLFAERAPPDRTDPEAAPHLSTDTPTRSELARLLVVSSSDAIANNLELVSNAVDWALEDPALLEIRVRGRSEPELSAPPPATAWRYKLAMVGLPMGGLALVGLVVSRGGRR